VSRPVYFYNEGEIDIRAVRMFGISAKVGTNPIGYFGTGLKYAIAILLRENHKVTIHSGNKKYVFEKIKDQFRGKDFSFIKMNGEELPFTTELGKNWEVWQAFRELHCNAKDEGGDSTQDIPYIDDTTGQTIIEVDGYEMSHTYGKKDEIILSDRRSPIFENKYVEIYEGSSDVIYYRGIKIFEPDNKTFFTYNVLEQLPLTEDRTLPASNELKRFMTSYLGFLSDKTLIKKALTTEGCYENEADYDWLNYNRTMYGEPTEEFDQVVGELHRKNCDKTPKTLLLWYKQKHQKESIKHLVDVELSEIQVKQLDKCKTILEEVYPDLKKYTIRVVEDLGQRTMAYANVEENTMVISLSSFREGTKYLMSTIIEELFHLRTGYNDLTRSFQTYIFDQLTNLIEERIVREPI